MTNIYYIQYNTRWGEDDQYQIRSAGEHFEETMNNILQTFRLTLIRE